MKAHELRDKSIEELRDMERSLMKDLMSLRFQLYSEQISNTTKVKTARRDLARVKTVIREMEVGRIPMVSEAVED